MPTSVREPAAWARPGPSVWALRPVCGHRHDSEPPPTPHTPPYSNVRPGCPYPMSKCAITAPTGVYNAMRSEDRTRRVCLSLTGWRLSPEQSGRSDEGYGRRPSATGFAGSLAAADRQCYLICRTLTLPLCVMLRCYECGAMGASVWLVSGTLALWCATCAPEWMTVEGGIEASTSYTMC